METIVKAENLYKAYKSRPVLNNLNIAFGKGRIIGLVGPNGCGKTTFIKIVCGLIKDYSGKVYINGHEPDVYTKGIISYLPEKTYLSSWMSPADAIDYFNDFYKDFDRVKAYELLRQLNLNPKQKLKTMSKGMQEKLHLTLVMSRSAELYMLDEPLGGVDPAVRSMILNTILKNYSENATLLISTHMIYDVENIFEDVVIMGYGQIIAYDSADNLREKTGKTVDSYFREVFRCL